MPTAPNKEIAATAVLAVLPGTAIAQSNPEGRRRGVIALMKIEGWRNTLIAVVSLSLARTYNNSFGTSSDCQVGVSQEEWMRRRKLSSLRRRGAAGRVVCRS